MDSAELRERIARWEDLHTEFKEWPVQPDDVAASLVAFANTDGGRLVLGVARDRTVTGVPDPNRAAEFIDSVALNNCAPPVTVVQEVVRLPGNGERFVLVVNVPEGDMRPYATNRGVYYIRTSSGRRRASREELLRLFQATESLYYDETPVTRATVADLDPDAVEQFLQQAFGRGLEEQGIPYETLLRNLRLLREDRPTLAGILFFGRRPQEFVPYAQISAARIPGRDLAAAPADRKDLAGRLPVMVEDAARFLRLSLEVRHEIGGFAPERRPELPEVALREGLVNALAHRDYTVGAPVRLLIFDDRVEIRTPGALPNTVTVEAMRLGAAHVLRNPTIYTLFARLGLVTGIRSGVFRLIQLVREATGREPDLVALPTEFVVAIPRRRVTDP